MGQAHEPMLMGQADSVLHEMLHAIVIGSLAKACNIPCNIPLQMTHANNGHRQPRQMPKRVTWKSYVTHFGKKPNRKSGWQDPGIDPDLGVSQLLITAIVDPDLAFSQFAQTRMGH